MGFLFIVIRKNNILVKEVGMLLGLLIAALIVIAILILNNKTKLEAQKNSYLTM
jgi:hypothetical protein